MLLQRMKTMQNFCLALTIPPRYWATDKSRLFLRSKFNVESIHVGSLWKYWLAKLTSSPCSTPTPSNKHNKNDLQDSPMLEQNMELKQCCHIMCLSYKGRKTAQCIIFKKLQNPDFRMMMHVHFYRELNITTDFL